MWNQASPSQLSGQVQCHQLAKPAMHGPGGNFGGMIFGWMDLYRSKFPPGGPPLKKDKVMKTGKYPGLLGRPEWFIASGHRLMPKKHGQGANAAAKLFFG